MMNADKLTEEDEDFMNHSLIQIGTIITVEGSVLDQNLNSEIEPEVEKRERSEHLSSGSSEQETVLQNHQC